MKGRLVFEDIIKKSVLELENFTNISIVNMIISLCITLIVALLIFYIYKLTFQGVVYSYNFNATLVLLCLVTSMVIMTISSNIVLSLGMVGALSIVRFRAAIKDPRDIVFMFWSIAAGLASGAGIYTIALGGSIFIGLVLIIMSKNRIQITTYLFIIKYEKSCHKELLPILDKLKYDLKSKSVIDEKIELTLELKKVGKNTAYVETIADIEGVDSAVLLKYNGDYAQ